MFRTSPAKRVWGTLFGISFFVFGLDPVMNLSTSLAPPNPRFENRPTQSFEPPKATLSKLDFQPADPHLCDKSEDAYYAPYRAAIPQPCGIGRTPQAQLPFRFPPRGRNDQLGRTGLWGQSPSASWTDRDPKAVPVQMVFNFVFK